MRTSKFTKRQIALILKHAGDRVCGRSTSWAYTKDGSDMVKWVSGAPPTSHKVHNPSDAGHYIFGHLRWREWHH